MGLIFIASRRGEFISWLKGETRNRKRKTTTAKSMLADMNRTFLFVFIDH